MEEFKIVDFKRMDFRELTDGKNTIIKLTKSQILQLLSGKILEGFTTRIGLDNDLNNNGGKK